MKTFRDLLIWQKAMMLVTATYEITKKFPKDEIFGLTSQLRRCSVSIPSNIAEGFGRNSLNEISRFASISLGSLYEFQTQIEIAKNIDYITDQQYLTLNHTSRELEAMIASFIRKTKNSNSQALRH
ncbi:MAG: four helix bundle protein [Flavobacterium sp.]|nr:MAG: four helix bundle protein [Flavobacterium sp.]